MTNAATPDPGPDAAGHWPEPAAAGPPHRHFPGPPAWSIDKTARYSAELITSMGTMTAALDPYSAPHAVNNFVALARQGFYDGLIFHRIIKGFMAQAGCPDGDGRGGPGYTFDDELPKPGRYEMGSLAMANSGPNTNGSQFFITVAPNPDLNGLHTVFGEVTEGLDVVKAISKVPRDESESSNKPLKPVTIESVSITDGPR